MGFFEFCEFVSDEVIFSGQDGGLVGFFLKGLDFVFDDFEELDGRSASSDCRLKMY